MKLINFLIRISKFVLLIGCFHLNNQLLAEKKNCPKDFPSIGTKFIVLDENQFKIRITDSKYLQDALNDESLAERIALLKLDVVESYQKFIRNKISNIPTQYGGYKYTEKFDNSWNTMKKSIASMRDLGTCIEKDRILFSGEWTKNSITKVSKIIELEDLYDELLSLSIEDPEFKIEDYPFLLSTEDPILIKEFLENWKKK